MPTPLRPMRSDCSRARRGPAPRVTPCSTGARRQRRPGRCRAPGGWRAGSARDSMARGARCRGARDRPQTRRVRLDLVHRSLAEHRSLVEHRHRTGHPAHELHVVLDHEHRAVRRRSSPAAARLLASRRSCPPTGSSSEQEAAAPASSAWRSPAIARGRARGRRPAVRLRREADSSSIWRRSRSSRSARARPGASRRHPARTAQRELDVLQDGVVDEDRGGLELASIAQAGDLVGSQRPTRSWPREGQTRPRVGLTSPVITSRRRRLAGAVRPDDETQLAGPDGEVRRLRARKPSKSTVTSSR